jgi:hypothetical protein
MGFGGRMIDTWEGQGRGVEGCCTYCMYLGSTRASCRPPYGTAICASELDRVYPALFVIACQHSGVASMYKRG